ncbi:MAG: dienelactone hydrolase family protein [Opitutaceae bacterium]|nr:dienelactone hydrolase family protein [Opitutaceae bacterium]
MKTHYRTWAACIAILLGLTATTVARGAEDPIDMQRVRDLRTRMQKGDTLSAEERAYYDRGVEARNQQKQRSQPPAKEASAADDELKRATREMQDPAAETFTVSDEACPLEVIEVPTPDKNTAIAVVRKPPGKGPFPAIVFLHGGMGQQDLKELQTASRNQPTRTRFLAAGYVIVSATFRSRKADPQTRDALVDCLAIIAHVKKMPEVDPKSLVVFGGSGGGSLALELAGEMQLCAVVAGEPASVLFTGMMTKDDRGPELPKIMGEPKAFYTPELQKFTRDKIRKISCPILIVHGDQHPLKKINHEIMIPELKAAGKHVEVIVYPGQPHGFYWGTGKPEAALKCFDDSHAYIEKHLTTKPKPLNESLVRQAPVVRGVEKGDK